MSNIKIAIIGQGAIGPRHTDAVLNTPGTALACMVDPHPSAAQGASKYNCPIFTSVDAILEAKNIDFDAAIACTPNHTHVATSKQLLQAGKHVLCEKPTCVDVASGQELVRAFSRVFRGQLAKTSRSNAPKTTSRRYS
jgi:predicted dehydrogenase